MTKNITKGVGCFYVEYSDINWEKGDERFEAIAGRPPMDCDIFSQKSSLTLDVQRKMFVKNKWEIFNMDFTNLEGTIPKEYLKISDLKPDIEVGDVVEVCTEGVNVKGKVLSFSKEDLVLQQVHSLKTNEWCLVEESTISKGEEKKIMNENKLRKFKLLDKEGYKSSHHLNYVLLREHLKDNCFEGIMEDGHLWYSKDVYLTLITGNEFQFFEEVFEEGTPTFPQIGDRVTYSGNKNCEVVGVHKDTCMLLTERGDYHLDNISSVVEYKPLTEDEIITRSEVKNLIQSYTLETALDYLMEEYIVEKRGRS